VEAQRGNPLSRQSWLAPGAGRVGRRDGTPVPARGGLYEQSLRQPNSRALPLHPRGFDRIVIRCAD